MNNNAVENLCRSCLSENSDTVSVFQNNFTKSIYNLSDMIMALTSVQISSEDKLSKRICLKCAAEINHYYLFKLKIENSDRLLRKQISLPESNQRFPVTSYDHFMIEGDEFQIKEEIDFCCDNEELNSNFNSSNENKSLSPNKCNSNNTKESFNEKDGRMSQNCAVKEESDVSSEDDAKDSSVEENFSCSESQSMTENCIKEEHKDSYGALKSIVHHLNKERLNASDKQGKTQNPLKMRRNKGKHNHHFRKKFTNNFKCNICQKQFAYDRCLATHIKNEHTSFAEERKAKKKYKCNKCKASYCEEEPLKKHIDEKHVCTICKKRVQRLSVHIRSHTGEKAFLCPICGKGFNQQAGIDEHMLRHRGVKSFACDSCEMSFITKYELNLHSRKHSETKDYQCDICGAMFSRKYKLNAHRDVKHFGKKRHECEVCHKNFLTGGMLKNHKLIHSGEKPHSCTFCDKVFTLKTTLTAHLRTHTGEKPYVCNICEQAFGQRSTLRSHKEKENHS